MIQRKQTVYWFIAILVLVFFLFTPYGNVETGETVTLLKAKDNILMLALTVLPALCLAVTIFLFKNRPLQITISRVALVLLLAVEGLAGWNLYQAHQAGNQIKPDIGIALPVIALILVVFAIKGVRDDERLVRSADRFR